ncbi:MAG TPA: leucine-rich repeat domain-containing protein, partial [Ktedonobacterales bacterium]
YLSELEDLSIGKNRLKDIPPVVFQLHGLRRLNLAENEIAEVPAEIGGLGRLRMLDLGHNRIRELPVEMGALTELEDALYLSDNRLEGIPEPIFRDMRRLRYLGLTHHPLAALCCSLTTTAPGSSPKGRASGCLSCGWRNSDERLPIRHGRLSGIQSTSRRMRTFAPVR